MRFRVIDISGGERNETKRCRGRNKIPLGNFIMLNLYKQGVITREQYLEIRDRLIDEYKPIIGGLERGLPWILDELEK